MSTSNAWRERFLTLIADVRRGLELPAESDDCAQGAALLATFVVDDVRIELTHTTEGPASGPRFLMQSYFGPVSPDAPVEVLADVLAKNHGLARLQLGNYGLDDDHDELVFNLLQPMPGLTADQLADAMTQISAIARQWREDHAIAIQ